MPTTKPKLEYLEQDTPAEPGRKMLTWYRIERSGGMWRLVTGEERGGKMAIAHTGQPDFRAICIEQLMANLEGFEG